MLLLWVPYVLVRLLDESSSRTLVIFPVMATVYLVNEGATLARSRLEIDAQGLRGWLEHISFDVRWRDVRAVTRIASGKNEWDLLLGMAGNGVLLPLGRLQANAVLRAVAEVAPEKVLASDAFDRLGWVKKLEQEHAALLAGLYGPVRIRIKKRIAVIGWFGLVMFLLFLLWSADEGLALRLLFLGFVLAEVFVLYTASALIEITPNGVRLIMPYWPTLAIRWDELERAETDYNGGQIVLYGPGKRMTMPGFGYWRGSDMPLAQQAFFGHLERVNVPIRRSATAVFKLPKGTRVPRS